MQRLYLRLCVSWGRMWAQSVQLVNLGQPRHKCGAIGTHRESEVRLNITGIRDGMSFLAWGLLCVVPCARTGR